MTETEIPNKLMVKRSTVYKVLQFADPKGNENRLANKLKSTYGNPGSNYVWHLDGYDKLK